MVEQDAKRIGRQAPEPWPEPGNDDGTGCQKSRETSPGTLAGTRKDDGTGCQKSRETSPGTLAGTGKDDGTGCQKSIGRQAPEP